MKAGVWSTVVILGLAIAAGGCQRLMNQDAAIQKAIRDHLTERSDLDMTKMTLEMHEVKVNGDKATAEVVFRTTTEPPAQMNYHYDLHRESGLWKVDTGRPSAASNQHPQMGEGEAAGDAGSDAGELPAGHPPIGQAPIGQSPTDQPSADQMNPHGDMPLPSQR
jgi:hypothetical protein